MSRSYPQNRIAKTAFHFLKPWRETCSSELFTGPLIRPSAIEISVMSWMPVRAVKNPGSSRSSHRGGWANSLELRPAIWNCDPPVWNCDPAVWNCDPAVWNCDPQPVDREAE